MSNPPIGSRLTAYGLRLVLSLALGLGPWALGLAAQDPPPPPVASAATSCADWLEALRAVALTRGISEATVTAALATVVEPNTVVVARDRAQPERVQSLDAYVKNRYHKAAANFDPSWDLRGVVKDLQALYLVGDALVNSRTWPNYREGSEFRAVRDASRKGKAD